MSVSKLTLKMDEVWKNAQHSKPQKKLTLYKSRAFTISSVRSRHAEMTLSAVEACRYKSRAFAINSVRNSHNETALSAEEACR